MSHPLVLGLRKKKPNSTTVPVLTPAPTNAPVTAPAPVWRGPDLTPDILSGKEPFPDSSVYAQPATEEDLEKITAEFDQAREDAEFEIDQEPSAKRIKWFGKVWQLAESIKNDHDQGHLGGISLEKAFAQACAHYEKPDGESFTPGSLRESLRQREDKMHGQPS
jgi:hypothetical protein